MDFIGAGLGPDQAGMVTPFNLLSGVLRQQLPQLSHDVPEAVDIVGGSEVAALIEQTFSFVSVRHLRHLLFHLPELVNPEPRLGKEDFDVKSIHLVDLFADALSLFYSDDFLGLFGQLFRLIFLLARSVIPD